VTPRVCVVLVNWNGWRHTVECLESVFRQAYPRFQVVVCDNGSEDGSVDRLKAWASGELAGDVPASSHLRHLSLPPVTKPIAHIECDRLTAETGGSPSWNGVPLILVRNGANLGCAGANNVGMRYAVESGGFEFCWLLNNDTVVESTALREMVDQMLRDTDAGMCGATVLYYCDPTRIQSLGGATYNKWTGVPRCIAESEPFAADVLIQRGPDRLDFINGACMLVSTKFIRDVGFMSTRYFLYYEEIDWSVRAKGRYTMTYAPRSLVYHKHGATIGSSTDPAKISPTSDYYALLNRLLFTRTYYPYALPTVYLGFVVTIVNRLRRGQWRRIPLVGKVLWTHVVSLFERSPA
jgi:GT2 family glycosyltransferase